MNDLNEKNLSTLTRSCTKFFFVLVPGDIPQNISVNNHSAYAVFIEWQPPLVPNGIITLYTIYANYNNGSSDQFSVNATERSYKLSGLSPHQLIGISISASTAIGEGSISSPILERTSQEGKLLYYECNTL